MHPIAIDIPMRVSRTDDVLPLKKPITGLSGKVYKELPLPAGTPIVVSIFGYNQYVTPAPSSSLSFIISYDAGTLIYGAQTLMNSGPNVG